MSGVRDFVVENNELVGNTSFIGFRGVNCSIIGLLHHILIHYFPNKCPF